MADINDKLSQEFWLLGFWSDPYGRHDREYFWGGPYDSRKEAQARGKVLQERGQPRRFINWVKGTNRIYSDLLSFLKACKKVGMNPAIDFLASNTIDEKIKEEMINRSM